MSGVQNWIDREAPGTIPVVLIVDDDPRVSRAVARVLRRRLRVEVLLASSRTDPEVVAAAAISDIARRPPALVVCDGLDGAVERVLQVAQSYGVPLVCYTGEGDRFADLACPVVRKPDDVHLRSVVSNLLGAG